KGFIEGKANPYRLRNTTLRDLLFIDQQGCGRCLADPASIVFELDADDMIAGGERLMGSNAELVLRLVGIRIGKGGLAILYQQGPAAVAASYCCQHAVRAPLWDRNLGGNRPRLVFEVRRRTLRDTDHSRKVDELAAASGEARPNCWIGARCEAGIKRVDIVLPCLDIERVLELLELVRKFFGQIVCLAEILVDVVELPLEVVGAGFRSDRHPWQAERRRARHPAILVNGPIPKHLEILGAVLCRRRSIVEGIDEAHAVYRLLLHTV